ncbi:MAG: DUF4870 domain-containing protein, partial [Blastocatellia bacterium]
RSDRATQVYPGDWYAGGSTQPQGGPTSPQFGAQTPPQPPPGQPSGYQPGQQGGYQPQTPPPSFQTPPVYGQQPAPWSAPDNNAGGLQKNIAGALCYLLIPAIIFLVVEPYNKNRFIRFHAFQGIFLSLAWMVLPMINRVLIFALPGFIDWVFRLTGLFMGIGFLILWIFSMVKAYNNESYKLPIIGDLAEQQSR